MAVELGQNTLKTLRALSHIRIEPWKVKEIPESPLVVGGYGEVRMARLIIKQRSFFLWRPRVSVLVAIKALKPPGDDRQRIRMLAALARELRVWSKLKHKHILALRGFYFDEKSYKVAWIATSWQENGHVLNYLGTHELNQAQRLKLVLDTARGLTYLHSLSPPVCHGDIKAENTLVDEGGNALLCDFGLATMIENGPSGLTTTGPAKMTPQYAAPELIRNNNALHTLQSDVWSWGCLVLVIMTGILPYYAKTSISAIAYAMFQKELPADLATNITTDFVKALLDACWKYDPDDRRPMDWLTDAISSHIAKPFWQNTGLMTCVAWGDGWKTIHNPDLQQPSKVGLLPITDGSDTRPCTFSPSGQYAALQDGAPGWEILLYDSKSDQMGPSLDSEDKARRFKIGGRRLSRVRFSSEGRFLAVASQNGSIKIWRVDNSTLKHELLGHKHPVSSLAFAAADTILVSASFGDGTLRSWSLETGTALHVLPIKNLWDLAGSPHHPFVIATGISASWVFQTASGLCWRLATAPTENTYALIPEGSYPASGWAIQESLKGVVFRQSGRSFITGRGRGDGLRIWDIGALIDAWTRHDSQVDIIEDREMVWRDVDGPQSSITTLAISEDDSLAASGSSKENNLVLWNLQALLPIARARGTKFHKLNDIAFRPGSYGSEGTLTFSSHTKASSQYVKQTVKYEHHSWWEGSGGATKSGQ